MSGHSKWSKIKRQKGVLDQRRGAAFSKLAKVITTVVRQGKSGDPAQNPALRVAVEKAKQANMPKANIQRAIESGLSSGGEGLETMMIEGYGAAGVGIIVRAKTDNRSRTTAEIKNIFEKTGGSVGAPGSAAFLFGREGGEYVATAPMVVANESADRVSALIDKLESHQDVDRVWNNAKLE